MIADKLKDYRSKRGWSQDDLAEKMSVSRSLVAKWEQGRANPTADDLDKLAELFGVKPEDLASYKDLQSIYKKEQKKEKKSIRIVLISAIAVFVLLGAGVAVWASLISSARYTVAATETHQNVTLSKVNAAANTITSFEFSDGTAIKADQFANTMVTIHPDSRGIRSSQEQNLFTLKDKAGKLAGYPNSLTLNYDVEKFYNGFGKRLETKLALTNITFDEIPLLPKDAVRGFLIDFAHEDYPSVPLDPTANEVFRYRFQTLGDEGKEIDGGIYPAYQCDYLENECVGAEDFRYQNYHFIIDVDEEKYATKLGKKKGEYFSPRVYLDTEEDFAQEVSGAFLYQNIVTPFFNSFDGNGRWAPHLPYQCLAKHFAWSSAGELTWVLVGFTVQIQDKVGPESYEIREFDTASALLKTTTISSLAEAKAFKKQATMDYAIVYDHMNATSTSEGALVGKGHSYSTSFSDDYGLFPKQGLVF
jgi:transcriptional regulator with XRE-family HTH domain